MNNIKKFDEYEKNNIINSERELMELELNNRKLSKRYNNDNDISIYDIIKKVSYEIENNVPHKITIGNRTEQIDGSVKSMLHVEYQSIIIGILKVFKPIDTARKGYFEINGKVFKEDISIIRNFYIDLCSYIK